MKWFLKGTVSLAKKAGGVLKNKNRARGTEKKSTLSWLHSLPTARP